MSLITYFEFNELFERRDSDLTDEEKEKAVEWATCEIDLGLDEWSEHIDAMWKVDPEWAMKPFYEFMSFHGKDLLERYFWGISLIDCCPRHLGSAPIAIDSDETTPRAWDHDLCYCCNGSRRHLLRNLQRAYKLAQQPENEDRMKSWIQEEERVAEYEDGWC